MLPTTPIIGNSASVCNSLTLAPHEPTAHGEGRVEVANVIVEGGAKGLYLLWGAPHVFRADLLDQARKLVADLFA
jgi:hypothetical protein